MWYDLCNTDLPDARLADEEKTSGGFRRFMMAHYFLWNYPRNSHLLSSRFGICERNCRGEPLWRWIKKIAALKETKIKWDDQFNAPQSQRFIITVDGTDFRVHEKKHPTLPIDRKQCSQKFNHGALKYEIGISIFQSKCVWLNGPFPGGTHDMRIFRSALLQEIPEGKLVVADRGYRTSNIEERNKLSLPDNMDHPYLNNFKSRARLRHETFNGRLKTYKCLSETWRHGEEKHKHAFVAVCVCTQYNMDNGDELFSV